MKGSRPPRPVHETGRAWRTRTAVGYGSRMNGLPHPEELLQRPVPDLALPSSTGDRFRLRGHVGRGPLVLFFFLHHGTPG